jgi:hypothetical protein
MIYFQNRENMKEEEKFEAKHSLTFRDALINTMRYFDIAPTNGTSHFLDIPL